MAVIFYINLAKYFAQIFDTIKLIYVYWKGCLLHGLSYIEKTLYSKLKNARNVLRIFFFIQLCAIKTFWIFLKSTCNSLYNLYVQLEKSLSKIFYLATKIILMNLKIKINFFTFHKNVTKITFAVRRAF